MAMAGSRACTYLMVLVCMLTAAPHSSLAALGIATYYTTYVPSACYGYDTSQFQLGPFIASVSSAIYNNGAACGMLYLITCIGNGCTSGSPIIVKVVDICHECAANQFDLSQQAYSSIALITVEHIKINYNQHKHSRGGTGVGLTFSLMQKGMMGRVRAYKVTFKAPWGEGLSRVLDALPTPALTRAINPWLMRTKWEDKLV